MRHSHPAPDQPDVLVGLDAPDDAGVYRINDDLAIVQTVDFFTPIVDDPFDWGRITAANALSDIYAMGGTPLTALQLVSWPRESLPFDLLGKVVEGGTSILAEAGCALIGGHSIDDPEPKYGFAVTGTVAPEAVVTVTGAEPGDVLVLTKPLGTGIISTALKRGDASDFETEAAVASMVQLNRAASLAMVQVGVKAATDVTGFGLLGHLADLTAGAEIVMADIPVLPGVRSHVEAGRVPGGTRRNLAALADQVDVSGIDEASQLILADAQTNGGLLMAVGASSAEDLCETLEAHGVTGHVIGEVTDGPKLLAR